MNPRDVYLFVADTIGRAWDVGEDNMEKFPSRYQLAETIVETLKDNGWALIDLKGLPVD